MRVIQVFRAPLGGLFRHVCDLARGLDARGVEVGVLCAEVADDPLAASRLADLEAHCRLGLRRVAMPRQIGWRDAPATTQLRAFAGDVDADILHGHGAKGGAYARLASIGARPRALYTPHGGSLHYKPRSPAGIVFMTLERLLLPLTAAVLFESEFTRGVYGRRVGSPPPASRVVYNGLAEDEFEPVAPEPELFDILYIGELRRLKGPFVLLDALARVTAEHPPRLLMVGTGTDSDGLQTHAGALGLADRVVFHPPMPARQAFARARIMVVPSLAESLPYIVLEAAAAGMPMLATRVGGIPEIFGPGADALIAPNDADALAAALSRRLADPDGAHVDAAILRSRVQSTFSQSRMTDGVIDAYRSATAEASEALPDTAARI